ncbi:MFS transporter [Verrucomicrobiota bacterium]
MRTAVAGHNEPERRTPPRAAVLVSTAVAFSLLGDQALYTILPTHFEDLGILGIHVGVLLSVNRWIRLLTNHVAERLVRRFDVTYTLVLALTVGAGTTLLYGIVSNFTVLLLARMTWGLCWSFLRQLGTMAAVDSADDRSVGRSVGLFHGISRIGSIVGFLLGGLLYEQVGYAVTFVILAASSMLAVPAAFAAGVHRYVHSSQFMGPQPPPPAHRRSGPIPCAIVSGLALSAVAASLGYSLLGKIGQSVTVGSIGIGIVVVNGILLASRHIIGTVGAPLLGHLLDRIGHKRSMTLFTMGAALALFAASVVSALSVLLGLLLCFFACGTAVHLSLTSQAGKRGARSFAHFVSASDLGAAAGPGLIWLVLEFVKQPALPFLAGGALYVVAFFLSATSRSAPAISAEEPTV